NARTPSPARREGSTRSFEAWLNDARRAACRQDRASLRTATRTAINSELEQLPAPAGEVAEQVDRTNVQYGDAVDERLEESLVGAHLAEVEVQVGVIHDHQYARRFACIGQIERQVERRLFRQTIGRQWQPSLLHVIGNQARKGPRGTATVCCRL